MAKNNKKEEIKEVEESTPVVEESKAEAPAEEVKAESAPVVEEVKAEAPVKDPKPETPAKEVKVEGSKKEEKDIKKYPPVQKGKKRVNVYAEGQDLIYITYPFTGIKKNIVLDLEDIKKLCWHEVPVEEIKEDGTVVKLTLENYDK